jgi:hypothetical protein
LYPNTTGALNSALGWNSLGANTTGSNNVALGYNALQANTTASNNTAVGMQSLTSNTTASRNTAVGYQAAYTGTTAAQNTIVGHQAGYYLTTGSYNVALGDQALVSTTTGGNNVAIGLLALQANTTASYNTAVGYQAGYSNTTGTALVAIGNLALDACTTGARNTAVGDNSLGALTTGDNNTSIGRSAGLALTTGVNNTFVGAYNGSTGGSGELITTGSKNSILGAYNGNQGGLDIRTASNYIVLSDGDGNPRGYSDGSGNWTFADAVTGGSYIKSTTYMWAAGTAGLYLGAAGSDNGRISQTSAGTGTTTTYIGNQAITTSSDIRLKENVKPTERNAVKLLSQWEIVDHTWNDPSDQAENNRNSRGVWTGVVAQQVQPITPWLVNKPTEDVNEDGSINPWTMDFGYAVPLLVKAIQELKSELDSVKAELAILKGN